MSAKLKTVTLGCKVNQYETQLVQEGLLRSGYEIANDQQTADLCIVNTCTVTSEGDSKSRQVIRRLNRQNPEARIVVMGCYATRDPETVAQLPGVSEVVTDKRELSDLMGRFGVIDIPTGISGFVESTSSLRQNSGRLFVEVHLLHHSDGPAPNVQPPAG